MQVAAVLCLCGGDIPGSETLEHQNTLWGAGCSNGPSPGSLGAHKVLSHAGRVISVVTR